MSITTHSYNFFPCDCKFFFLFWFPLSLFYAFFFFPFLFLVKNYSFGSFISEEIFLEKGEFLKFKRELLIFFKLIAV